MSAEQKEAEAEKIETGEKLTWSTIASLSAGIITSIAAAAAVTSLKPLITFIKQVDAIEFTKVGIALIGAILTVLVSIISLWFSRHDKKK